MGFRNWLANRIIRFLSQNADDAGDTQVDMKGQVFSVKELRRIEKEWKERRIID